jgi:hypothetical protein
MGLLAEEIDLVIRQRMRVALLVPATLRRWA